MRQLTIRLPEEQINELEAVADCEGVPIVDEIRAAVSAHIEAKRRDPEFQGRLRDSLERNQALLRRLTST